MNTFIDVVKHFPYVKLYRQPKKWSLSAIKNSVSKAGLKALSLLASSCVNPKKTSDLTERSNESNCRISFEIDNVAIENNLQHFQVQIKCNDQRKTEKLENQSKIEL